MSGPGRRRELGSAVTDAGLDAHCIGRVDVGRWNLAVSDALRRRRRRKTIAHERGERGRGARSHGATLPPSWPAGGEYLRLASDPRSLRRSGPVASRGQRRYPQ